jgi:hypothetical protein
MAAAVKISQAAKAGTGASLTTSNLTLKDGYFPPARAPANIGCDPARFFEIAVALSPTKPRSCGRALCAILNLVAQTAMS